MPLPKRQLNIASKLAGHCSSSTCDVPTNFSTTGYCGGNIGVAVKGATALATEAIFGDAVAVMEVGAGRIVGFAHAANYQNEDSDPSEYCLADPNLLQLMVDSVYWTLE